MVVQKITFDFMQSKLDDIRVVQGDTCRDIEFIASDIHGEIDPENYTFTFNMIKPDHTFVMVTLPSNILTITDQMWVYTGTSYYNLQIKNGDDEVIYSGQGAFIVDDALISEDDIESVASVNGYTFPDDFATIDQIEDIVEDMGFAKIDDAQTLYTTTWSSAKISTYVSSEIQDTINDDGTSDHTLWSSEKTLEELSYKAEINDDAQTSVSTWSSNKIKSELDNITTNYSGTERRIGTWIDGKPLYRITITVDNFYANYQESRLSCYYNYVDLSDYISGFLQILPIVDKSYIKLYDNTTRIPLYCDWQNGNLIAVLFPFTDRMGTLYLTLEYTKNS